MGRFPGRCWLAFRLAPAIVTAIFAMTSVACQGQSGGPDEVVSATSLRRKVLCGYQGWFRCPGDAAGMGWIHWSRDRNRIAPSTLTFEMWPDLREYAREERYRAPGFTLPDGREAELFSSDNAATVLRHFEWMRDYGIDGAWLQHFVVDLPSGPSADRYPSRRRVLDHVRAAATKTGRVWALSFDMSGMRADRIYDVLTEEWKRLVDAGIMRDPRYLHEGGRPVVQLWGFYRNSPGNRVTAEVGGKLIDFFKAPGPYSAYVAGGGDWNWREDPDRNWQALLKRFDAYSPWNVGNYSIDASGVKHAAMSYWADDKRACERQTTLWLPVVYPGFGWDNLQRLPAGKSSISRSGGRFLWEQYHELARLGVDSRVRRDVRRGRRRHGGLQSDRTRLPPRGISSASKGSPPTGTCAWSAKGERCSEGSGQ